MHNCSVFKKCSTSCTDLGFTLLATAISRKINYDVTQRRPEGAARLHTPKKRAPPSLRIWLKTKKRKKWVQQSWSEQEGKKWEKGGGERRFFSFSYIDDSNIPPASKSSSLSRSSTGSSHV